MVSWPRDSDAESWALDDDERARRVDRIRHAVTAGEYEVDAVDVADAVLAFYERSPDADPGDASD